MNARVIAKLGIMGAMVIIIVIIEAMLPPLPFLPPNFRLGFSNIMIMYALFFMGKKEAVCLVFIKAVYNVLRGFMAGVLSFSGGLTAVLFMVLFSHVFKGKISYQALSIVGAVFHNMGQLVVASVFLGDFRVFVYYFPVLLVVGVVMGVFTGLVFGLVLPAINVEEH